jgi:alpha-L-rhamnosidase
MAQVLGRKTEAQEYQALFQDIRRAFAKNYVNGDGIIGGNSTNQPDGHADLGDAEGSYALALQFGLLDEPMKARAVARLEQLVVKNKYHRTTGFWSSVELLLVLSANGGHDEAARMFNQDTVPSWGYMAEHGTTLWEAFDANTRNLSLNHWTHSAVSEWLWRDVAGLNPDEQSPGYRTFTIHPRPTQEVSWCKASYDSIRGKIVSNWLCDGGKFTLDATVPANSTATLVIPTAAPGGVKESGRPAGQADGVVQLGIEPNAVIYQVGSGVYHFTSLISSKLTFAH